MTLAPTSNRLPASALWICIALYIAARVCQIYADTLPILLVVILHVAPPAAFAAIHGALLLGWRGITAFTVSCLVTGAVCESLSLRTGFPFGHYYFTSVMGPKLFSLPFLLVFAYLGIGYCAWTLALLILGLRDALPDGVRAVAAPLLASFVMLAWDLAMDPQWATVDRAWIWQEGGAFFGVPVSNFLGWFLTAYLFFQIFALYPRNRQIRRSASPELWRMPIVMYAVCALGNLLIRPLAATPAVVVDAVGHAWRTADIRAVCSMISLVVMMPIALLAWLRSFEQNTGERSGNASIR